MKVGCYIFSIRVGRIILTYESSLDVF